LREFINVELNSSLPPSSSETKDKNDYKLERKRLKLQKKKVKKLIPRLPATLSANCTIFIETEL